ncbi:MAG: alpha/beta hydrolase [Candidatus Eiseniibacteriota bacterium]|jgi:pimeloyl-ACP methyl ester carboxylesterase
MMRREHGITTGLLVALLGVALTSPALAVRGLNPLRVYEQTPEQANIVYDDVHFETGDGLTLHGWFLPFQDQEGNAVYQAAPIIILAPPEEGNMGDLLWHYFRFFRGAPWHVLLFDWRGYGSSDDWELPERAVVIPEFIRDLDAAIDYAKTRPEWDERHLALFAFNMGAAITLATTATRDDVSCLALRGVYTTQEDLVAAEREINPVLAPIANPDYPAALEPLAVAPKIEVPVWIIAAEDDQQTTVDMGKRVYDALGGKREFWIAKGAGHTAADIPENVQIDRFTGNLHAFLRRYIGTAGY